MSAHPHENEKPIAISPLKYLLHSHSHSAILGFRKDVLSCSWVPGTVLRAAKSEVREGM